MNPISKVTGAITHPVRTATSVAGGAIGVAAAGVRTATRIVGRAAGQGDDAPVVPDAAPSPTPSPTLAVRTPAVDETAGKAAEAPAPAKKSAAKKAPAKKAPAKTSPAKQAATDKAPAKESPAKKAAGKKSAAKKAPTAQAATAGPAMAPDALAALDAAIDGDTSHVETETEVVYSSETASGSGTGPEEHLTEPLVDPAVAEALRSEAQASQDGAQPDQG